jgi:hypothetical protein
MLSSETMPRSITQMRLARPYFCSIAVTISSTVVTSLRLPANTSYPKASPPRLTTMAMLTCLQSGR